MNLRTLSTLALATAALAASAATLTIDNPNRVVVVPTTSTQIVFSGSFTASGGRTGGLNPPCLAGGANALDFTINVGAIFGNDTYAGSLFSILVTPSTLPGVYAFDSTGTALSSLYLRDGGGLARATYSVTVLPVPEPSSIAALGLGALGLLRRRKRA